MCMLACAHMCHLHAWCRQRPEDPLGLELLLGVSTMWLLGAELWSSARASSAAAVFLLRTAAHCYCCLGWFSLSLLGPAPAEVAGMFYFLIGGGMEPEVLHVLDNDCTTGLYPQP